MSQGSPTSGVGRVIAGRYVLLNRLGSGGMGHVWLAHDQRLACEVALKEIVFRDPAEARHEREARVARARAADGAGDRGRAVADRHPAGGGVRPHPDRPGVAATVGGRTRAADGSAGVRAATRGVAGARDSHRVTGARVTGARATGARATTHRVTGTRATHRVAGTRAATRRIVGTRTGRGFARIPGVDRRSERVRSALGADGARAGHGS